MASDKRLRGAGLEAERAFHAVLGAPGGPGPAHVMQFRPVGVECPGEELVPETLISVTSPVRYRLVPEGDGLVSIEP